jgi:pSer/pThr/pTyr-binding forkhead associated (FHA) protein
MSTCPYCGAETRPGDNFCLSCGHRLLTPASSSQQQQAQPAVSESTVPAQEGWMQQFQNEGTVPAGSSGSWGDMNPVAVANHVEAPTAISDFSTETGPTETGITHPARFILRADNGEVIQEFLLDKPEIHIGRAAGSDIVLSKDKLTSRHHALVSYEQGEYTLRDNGSSNGTFVNGQQLEKDASYTLQDNDHIGIGEYELIFRTAEDASAGAGQVDVPDMPTINVPSSTANDLTYRTREDENATEAVNDEFSTNVADNDIVTPPQPESPPMTPMPEFENPPAVSSSNPAPIKQSPTPTATSSRDSVDANNVTFNRLTSIPQPNLPDLGPMLAALSSLDGQVMSLQEQLNATRDAVSHHEEEIAQTTNQLRAGVRNVSDRMDNTIADVARTREALAWADLLQLMEDVMNNPRDIEYVTKLARKARELNKVFQMHQNVLNTLAECNSLLRSLLGEDK